MILLRCEACGGNDLKKIGNVFYCSYCGSKYVFDEGEQIISKKLTESEMLSLFEKANRLHTENRYSEELELLTKAFSMDETNTNTLLKLGRCYRCLNFLERAMECYRKTLLLNPEEGSAYANIGAIQLLRQNFKEAAAYYEKALPRIDKAEFDYWVANANYAAAIARLGDPKRAEKMIRESEMRGYSNGDLVRKMGGIPKNSFFAKIKALFS